MHIQIDRLRDPDVAGTAEARTVWDGLLATLPTVEPRYFYDDRGSALFERITHLPEYYQTRTELALLEELAPSLVTAARPRELVELGSGAGRKVHLLLDAMQQARLLRRCVMLDINHAVLATSVARLAASYPGVEVRGVVADFTRDLAGLESSQRRLLIFLAGTIGNLGPSQLPPFLALVRRSLQPDDRFLVGLDLVKDPARLEAAYNDSAGVTAAFNRNILAVLNDRFGSDFEPAAFEHVAFWDAASSWIEMRLRATRPMRVSLPGESRRLMLAEGDEIRTELSRKFTRRSFAAVLGPCGLELERWDADREQLFALALCRVATTQVP